MAEMVRSAVVQEVVSGAFSFMRNNHEEIASQSHLVERLKMAHLELKFALERSMKMPITEVSLLQRRMVIKHAFEECRDMLNKHTALRVNLEDEGAEQRVPLSPSLPKRIMHAIKPFFSTGNGSMMSRSCVRRFEWFAEKADKFVRDIEAGYSLAGNRFSSPLITQLLEGKYLHYEMVSGSQTRTLIMFSCCLEDYGAVAIVKLEFKDVETPMKWFRLDLMLRLSESTDIVGISTKCLGSLEPQFKSAADVASGELAQISTHVGFLQPEPADRELMFKVATECIRHRQEPLCCIGDGYQPSAKNIFSSELTEKFTEQVHYLGFQCFISAAGYIIQSSAVETNRNTIKAQPILELSVAFAPHFSTKTKDDKVHTYLETPRGEFYGPLDFLDISETAKFVPFLAVNCFKLEPPEREVCKMYLFWAHGCALFTVSKPTTEMGCAPKIGDGSKTRRVSKRKR